MRRLVAFVLAAVPLLLCSVAFGGGRTFNLATVLKGRQISLGRTEKNVTLRAPRGTRVSRALGGMLPAFVPVHGKLNAARNKVLLKLPAGRYYVSPQNRTFNIDAPPAPRPANP